MKLLKSNPASPGGPKFIKASNVTREMAFALKLEKTLPL